LGHKPLYFKVTRVTLCECRCSDGDDLVAQGAPAFAAATPMLSQLLKAEVAEREVRSIAFLTKVARVPSYKDLTGFYCASSDINEATV
jgi:hypothetical protein